jgi:hypothetical protein
VYTYLVLFALIVALVLSFATRRESLRLAARIVASLIILSSTISIGLNALLSRMFDKGRPTLVELQNDFPKHQQDMETLVRMSDEDPTFALITPTFSDRFADPPSPDLIRAETLDIDSLPEARWDQYRAVFNRDDMKLGIWRNPAGDIFIMADSFGNVGKGNAIGYLYCRTAERNITIRPAERSLPSHFEPCESNLSSGSRQYDRDSPLEAYSFQKLTDHWYVYDQGPSEGELRAKH